MSLVSDLKKSGAKPLTTSSGASVRGESQKPQSRLVQDLAAAGRPPQEFTPTDPVLRYQAMLNAANRNYDKARSNAGLSGRWNRFKNWASQQSQYVDNNPYLGYATDDLSAAQIGTDGDRPSLKALWDANADARKARLDAYKAKQNAQAEFDDAAFQTEYQASLDKYHGNVTGMMNVLQHDIQKAKEAGDTATERELQSRYDRFTQYQNQQQDAARMQGWIDEYNQTQTGDTAFGRYLTAMEGYGSGADMLEAKKQELDAAKTRRTKLYAIQNNLTEEQRQANQAEYERLQQEYEELQKSSGLYGDDIKLQSDAGYAEAQANYDEKLARYQELTANPVITSGIPDETAYQVRVQEIEDQFWDGDITEEERNRLEAEALQQLEAAQSGAGQIQYPGGTDAEIQQAAQELEQARFVLDYARANRDSSAAGAMAADKSGSAEEGLRAYEEDSANPIVSDEDRQAHEQYLADQRAFYESMGLSGDTLERALAADDEQWMRQYGYAQANASQFDPRYNQDYASPDERWSDSERYLFGYYWQNVGEERAREYAAELNRKYNAAEAAERDLETEEFATRNAGTAVLATAGAIGGHMLGGTIDFARMAAENAYRGDLYETQYEGISRWGDVATGAIAQDLNSKWGTIDESVPVLGGKGWGDVYQLFESMAESGASIAVGGETGSLAMFFGMAAASGTRDALDRGLDSDRALLTGLVNGIAEVAGEKLSVEKLLSNRGLSDFLTKGVWREVLKQGGVEASEETLTTLLNTMADLAINGDQSEVETSVYNYMLQGMTREEARKAALKDWINQLGQDALGGFLSGSVMSGAHYSAFAGPALVTRYDGNAQGMLDYAALLDQNSQAAQVADRYRPGFEKRGSISNYAAAKMMASFGEDVSGDEVQKAKSSIEESFGSVEAAKTAAEGIENADAETQQKVIELAESFGMKQSGNQPGLKAKGPNEAQRAAQRVLQVTQALENMENRRSEREASGMREAAEHSIPKEKAVTLEDGGKVTMARYDGSTGAVTVSVQKGDGDVRLMDRSELTGEIAQLFDDLEDALGNTAQAVQAFNQMQDGQDARYYGTDFRTMRELGQRGANLDNALKNYRGVLTEEQARLAYQMGQGMTRREGGKPIRRAILRGTGKVTLNGGTLEGRTLAPVSAKAREENAQQIRDVQALAKALDIDVVMYESQADADGKLEGANGAYRDGVIYLDINAGMNNINDVGKRMLFNTFAHELTHFIKENAPEQFEALQERIIDYLMQEKSIDFNGLVRSKMARASERLSYDGAVEEVIADSCETMLRDSKAVQDLANRKPGLFEAIRDYMTRFFDRILARHAEAKALQPHMQELQKIWDEALITAVDSRVSEETAADLPADNEFKTYIRETMRNQTSGEDRLAKLYRQMQATRGKVRERLMLPAHTEETANEKSSTQGNESKAEEKKTARQKQTAEEKKEKAAVKRRFNKAVEELMDAYSFDGEYLSLEDAEKMVMDYSLTHDGYFSEVDEAKQKGQYKTKRQYAEAQKAEKETKYSFGGRNAWDADIPALNEAEGMWEKGEDNESIRQKTGWFRGMDGKWRFEIDDSAMEVREDYRDFLENQHTERGMRLNELIYHSTLFNQYPQLANIDVAFDIPETSDSYGRWSGGWGGYQHISLNKKLLSDGMEGELLDTLIHEMQHAIQDVEVFAMGSNPEYWKRRLKAGYDGRTQTERIAADDAWRRYNEVRENDPQFFDDMTSLMFSTPDSPRSAVDWDTLEPLEPDPPEWQEFDKRRDALEKKYGDRIYSFMDLFHRVKYSETTKRTPFDLYQKTAGEIEARDVSNRRKLSADQRLAKQPDIYQEDIVFVGPQNKNASPEGDVMYSNREEALNHKGVDWMGDFTSIKEQLAKHRGEISQMAPLAEVTYLGEEKKALERLILDQLAQIGGPRMVRDGITFDFDQKGAEHIVLHAKSDELRAAALAAPYVAKYGKLISGQKNHENTNTTTLTYAAPVRINGEAVNVGVVIHFASNGRPRAVNVETENGGVFKIKKTAQGLRSRTGKSQVLQLLTRTVSTDRIAQGDGEVKYSERDNAKTDRELLMETNGEELTATERAELGKYRAKAEEVREREHKVQAALEEMDKMVRARDPNLQKQRAKVSNLQAGLNKALRELTQAETGNKTMLEIIRKEREIQRRRTGLATRETFTKRDLRGRITKLYNDLNRRITSPSEKKNIPVPVMEQAVEVLSAINMDSSREGSRAGEKLRQKLLDLQAKYRELENDPDFKQAAVYDATVAELLQNMVQAVGDTPINRMNASQMKAVLDALTALDKTARTALKIKMLGEERDAYQVARQMGEETQSVKKPHKSLLAQWLNAQLSPERMFNRLGGYHKDSAWSQVYRMLNDGQLKMTQIQMEGTMLFDGLMEGKDYDRFIDPKNTVDIGLKDRSGNAVPITHGMMAALYMHLQNEQNARHVAHGGLTVPNLKDYYNGRNNRGLDSTVLAVGVSQEIGDLRDKLKEAKSEEEKDRIRDQIREAEESAAAYIQGLRASIERQLSAYDRQWIAAAKELFDVYSKQRLNEATMEVYGIKRANVENYFPLSVNKDFLNTPFESIAKDMSLENAGFMKERVDSGKPIYLFDVGDVARSQIRRVSQYCGQMPVTRNFQKIWGKVQTGYRGSLQDDVREKFGSAGIQYVENLMADLNGARGGSEGPLADFFNAVRGHMAQASLTLSLRVAMGQTASYPTAASVVGWKALGRALAQGGKGNTVISRADQELIRKYSPLLWYRLQGNSTVELGDLANSNSRSARLWQKMRWATGWIQAMDGATVGRLWYAAQYYVEDHNKALQKGTDAYYREVAKVFNDIVEKTQPDYTTMQRPDILRNPNALVKQLTMFLTQRLQNFNILYDSAASYSQMKKDLAAGVKGVTQHDVLEARTTVRRAAVSQLVAAATITAFKMLADALLHSMKAYRDDDEELTGESISMEALDMFLDSLAGNILGGGEVFDIIEKYAFGKTYYGIDVSGVSTVTDVIEAANKFLDEALTEGATARDVWDKGGHKLAKNIASLLGVPYANGEKIVMGLIYHATDIVNGEFGHFEAGVDRTTAQEAHRLYRAYTANNYGTAKKIREQVGDDDKLNQALAAYIKQQYGDGAITEKQAVEQLQKFAGKDRKTAEKTMREYSAEVETGIKYARIGEELVAGNLSEAEAVKMWQKYGGMELEKAQSKASWTLYQNDHPDTTLEASSYATWFYKYRSILDAELYEDYYTDIKSCKGTDNNGDGKTDSGSAKAQKLLVIDALPISSDKKDALYRANGWSEKTLKDAPWHKR